MHPLSNFEICAISLWALRLVAKIQRSCPPQAAQPLIFQFINNPAIRVNTA
jgi:hypothetical protein